MKIDRLISDLGNSCSQFLINGNYFEIPSSVKFITEAEAKGSFAESVDQEALINELVLRVKFEEKEYFVKIGAKAFNDALANSHIEQLHDKTTSDVTFVIWASSIAYYHAIHHPEVDDDTVTIMINSSMIPVWLAKRAEKFSVVIDRMKNRFLTEVEIELLTQGFNRKLKVKVVNSTTRIEGETQRFALKYDLDLKLQESAIHYKDAYVVIDDIGGQTQDLVKLQKGLKKPASADDFQSVTDVSFLKVLENLRKEKLMMYFTDLRTFEEFIVKSVPKQSFVYTNPTTWQSDDLTDLIEPTLKRFVKVTMEKCLTTFSSTFKTGDEVYFIHTGGVVETLKSYYQEYLLERLGDVAVERHIFPVEGRKLNLYGGEIVAKHEALKNEKMKL